MNTVVTFVTDIVSVCLYNHSIYGVIECHLLQIQRLYVCVTTACMLLLSVI